jgi:hypothetical protein
LFANDTPSEQPTAPKAPQSNEAKEAPRKLTATEQARVERMLRERAEQTAKLQAKAQEITAQIGVLASSGKLPTTADAVETMKKLVSELSAIQEDLEKIKEEIAAINGWIEGQNEALPIMSFNISELQRMRPGNYLQVQWRDAQDAKEGWNVRRARFTQTYTVDPRTSMRFSFDVAAGGQRQSADLRDAFLQYNIVPSEDKVGIELMAGQVNMGLGYELERSSADREFPERAQFNQRLFNGERNRGMRLRYGLSKNSLFEMGIWNALTFGDPQQTALNTFRNPAGSRLGYSATLRYYTERLDVGVSAFFARRPEFRTAQRWNDANGNGVVDSGEIIAASTGAKADRQFVYLDAAYVGLIIPQISIRGEVMFGKDRVPTLRSDGRVVFTRPTEILGAQTILTYNINSRNQLAFKYEFFDPDRNFDRDSITGWGIAYHYFINPNARITIARENFLEGGDTTRSRSVRNDVTTLRYQFRF